MKLKIIFWFSLALAGAVAITTGVTTFGGMAIASFDDYVEALRNDGVIQSVNELSTLYEQPEVGIEPIDFDAKELEKRTERELLLIDDIKKIMNNWKITDSDSQVASDSLFDYLDILEEINHINQKILEELESDASELSEKVINPNTDNQYLKELYDRLNLLKSESQSKFYEWQKQLMTE